MEPYGDLNPVVRLYINKKNLVFQPFERGVGFIRKYNRPRNIENKHKSGCSNDQHPLCALKQDVIVRVCIWP